jgi:parallel beta-helix repeat protein/predicted outer membrane repeat protein
MKRTFTPLLLFVLAQASLAQLSGPLSGTLGPGTYHVVGAISVISSNSLRLMPGTTFQFEGPYPFEIYGTLLAEGTGSDSIVFTTDPLTNPNRWRGLRFIGATCSGSHLTNCVVRYATNDVDGSGINCSSCSPTFAYCVVIDNSATGFDSDGGAVACRNSSPAVFMNCIFTSNSAWGRGGAIYCESNSSAIFTNCTISGNWAGSGGGVYCGGASPDFTNCLISNNIAQNAYGGVACDTGSSPTFTNCLISSNMALNEHTGGVGCHANSSPIFTNCVISGNVSNHTAGGVGCYEGCSPVFRNCTIAMNTGNNGGGVACDNSSPSLKNTIIAFSEGEGICFNNSVEARVLHCDLFGNNGGPFQGTVPSGLGQIVTTNANGDSCDIYCNIYFDPILWDTTQGDFHLYYYSPCIGAADTTDYSPTDIESNPRPNPAGSKPDIGAYESEYGSPVLCGNLRGTFGPGEYHVVGDIYVSTGQIVRLLPHTSLLFDGPFGFEITGRLFAEGTASDSIVFGAGNTNYWRGLYFNSPTYPMGQLAYCRVEAASSGAVRCDHSSPTFMNCTISGNGGGVLCDHSSSSFVGCDISGNWGFGGVSCVGEARPSFTNCAISGNWGGGVSIASSSPTFKNCTISGNWTTGSGGGVACSCEEDFSPRFIGCTITGNTAWGDGGGIISGQGSLIFTNCTINRNTAFGNGGGVLLYVPATPVFTNCVIIGNDATQGAGVYSDMSDPIFNSTVIAFSEGTGIHFRYSWCTVEYCDIFGNTGGDLAFNDDDPSNGPPGIGQLVSTNGNGDSCDVYMNIYLDPMFIDTSLLNYHLMWTECGDPFDSPCIDAGDPSIRDNSLRCDFGLGDSLCDIGAYGGNAMPASGALHPKQPTVPSGITLFQNYPNPFNSTTMIRYDVPQAGKVSLTIFNLLGQKVETLFDGRQVAGSYRITWDAGDLPSGVYLCRMQTQRFMQTRKMLLVK